MLSRFASNFNGKASPIHLYWHSFDLAHARYSGRAAPVPANADPVTAEAYSHEVIAVGFWPGDNLRTPYPAFYSYIAPEPDRLIGEALSPAAAEWQDTGSGSLAVLPYDAVRTTADPSSTLLAFFESGYRAGAICAGWDTTDFETKVASEEPGEAPRPLPSGNTSPSSRGLLLVALDGVRVAHRCITGSKPAPRRARRWRSRSQQRSSSTYTSATALACIRRMT